MEGTTPSLDTIPESKQSLSLQTDMPKIPTTKSSYSPGSPSYRKPAPVYRPSVDDVPAPERPFDIAQPSQPTSIHTSEESSSRRESGHSHRNKLKKKRSRPNARSFADAQNRSTSPIPPVPPLPPGVLESVSKSKAGPSQKVKARKPLQPIPETLVLTAQDLLTPVELLQEHTLPTQEQLETAAELELLTEKGQKIKFRSLFEGQKSIICFIRHFWCPLCQDYMSSITANADPLSLAHHNVSLSIISNGSHKMIKSYRRIFRTPFAVYTDPSLELYNAMGMTLQTLDGGRESEKGDYVQHGLMGGIAMVVGHAAKARVPVWEKGGHIEQLGGEFILGPGLTASFAHRMVNTRAHVSIKDILAHAGVVTTRRIRQRDPAQTNSTITDQLRLSSHIVGVPIPEESEINCGTDECSVHSSHSSVDLRAKQFHRRLNQQSRPESGTSLKTLDLWVVADQSIHGSDAASLIEESADVEEVGPEFSLKPAPPVKRIHKKRPSSVTDIIPPPAFEKESTFRSSPPSPASSLSAPRTPTSAYSVGSSQARARQRSTPAHSGPVYRKLHTPIQEYPTQTYTSQHRSSKSVPNAPVNGVSVDPDSLVLRFIDGQWRKIRSSEDAEAYGPRESRDDTDVSLSGYDNTDDFPESTFYPAYAH